MPLVLVDIGADAMLESYFNKSNPVGGNNLTCRFFTNNITPADTDTAGTYTEATGGGYNPVTLTAGSWTITPANDPSDAVYAQQTVTFTGPLTGNPTIYGYFVTDADSTLIWAEKFASGFTPANDGDNIKITPKFRLSKGTPT